MSTLHVKPSLAAAAALVQVRLRMTNQQRVDKPLDLEQAQMLAEYAPDLEFRIIGLRIIMDALATKTRVDDETAAQLMNVAAGALFDYVLPAQPTSHFLTKFMNAAYRYGQSAWHERAAAAYKAMQQYDAESVVEIAQAA